MGRASFATMSTEERERIPNCSNESINPSSASKTNFWGILYSDHSVPRWVPPNEPKNPGRAHERARGLGSEAQVRYGTRTKKPGRGPCARGLVSESWSHGGTTSEGCCDVAKAGKAEARHNRPRTWFRPRNRLVTDRSTFVTGHRSWSCTKALVRVSVSLDSFLSQAMPPIT